jgi:hypothetical protein
VHSRMLVGLFEAAAEWPGAGTAPAAAQVLQLMANFGPFDAHCAQAQAVPNNAFTATHSPKPSYSLQAGVVSRQSSPTWYLVPHAQRGHRHSCS